MPSNSEPKFASAWATAQVVEIVKAITGRADVDWRDNIVQVHARALDASPLGEVHRLSKAFIEAHDSVKPTAHFINPLRRALAAIEGK